MMLDHIGEDAAATRVGNAVRDVLEGGEIKSLSAGAVPTDKMGDMVLDALKAGVNA